MQQQKVLVFGGGGQLGVELCRVFRERAFTVERYDRQSLNVTDRERVEQVIATANAFLVVNSAAYNQVDIAEHEPLAAFEANALAVRNLALACRQSGARLVHYSTDYVFDGVKGSPYVETDTPHPLGAYGVSKLAGEHYAQAYLEDALILRTSGVFGPAGASTARGNFVETMLRVAQRDQRIRVLADHFASPTYAPALAERTAEMVQKGFQGIYHMGGGDAISWYHFAELIFELAGLSPVLEPADERQYRTPARRPKFSALSNQKMEAAGIPPMPPFREAVDAYLKARRHTVAEQSKP